MVWADDDFSYFDWLNRLSKFGHCIVPDHLSFCGFFFFLNSELDGLCPRPSICQHVKKAENRFVHYLDKHKVNTSTMWSNHSENRCEPEAHLLWYFDYIVMLEVKPSAANKLRLRLGFWYMKFLVRVEIRNVLGNGNGRKYFQRLPISLPVFPCFTRRGIKEYMHHALRPSSWIRHLLIHLNQSLKPQYKTGVKNIWHSECTETKRWGTTAA